MSQSTDITTNNNNNNNNSNNWISPKKSLSDKRDYRIITLKNGLQCILISDPETDKAAAALNVNVGHFADPEQLPGLAHFLEHMLFLGTEKYPNESEYNGYLKDHGGSDNAATGMESTCYQFDVHKDYLEGALDRFAQFFIAPLFTESATDREMQAVNSENENNLQSDEHRLYQLDKSLAMFNHPFYKFGTGNIATLRDSVPKDVNVRQSLLNFHKEYYSASIMKLAIIGQEDLDKLTQYAENMFLTIKNTGREIPKYSKEVFDPKTFPLLLKVTPVKEKRELILGWPMEPIEQYFMERPESLLSFCLGDEGPGSVLAFLKKLGYATELMAGVDYNTPQFSMFRVSVSLTPEGLSNWERVVEIVYRYIAKMNEVKDERWVEYWEEQKKVKAMNFTFKSKENPYYYVGNLAEYAHRFPPENLLECLGGLFFKCEPKLVKHLLRYLNTDNSFIQLVAKDFEPECKETEKWYGTKYQKIPLTTEQLSSWKNLKPSEDDKWLNTPPPNPYIADDFSLFCEKHNRQKESVSTDKKETEMEKWLGEVPQVLVLDDHLKLRFKMDEYFKQPKLGVKFKLSSPTAGNTCVHRMMSTLLLTCFHDVMSELTYVFAEAGLSTSAGFDGVNGINVDFFGYNQKLPALIDTVLNKLINFELSQEQFEVNLERYKRQIQSFRKAKAYQQINLLNNYITNHQGFSLEEMEEQVNKITYEGVMNHHKKLFEQLFVEGLIYGNAEKDQAVGIYADLIKKYMLQNNKVKDFKLQDVLALRKGPLKIPADGATYTLRFENFNHDDNNSSICNDYYFTLDNSKDWAAMRLMSHMASVPCFDQLRTKEQLGYLVWSFPDIVRGLMSFRVIIQSVVADPVKLDERIELFLQDFRKQLEKTDKETFESNKEGVINDMLEKTKGVNQQIEQYWVEYDNGRYDFERRERVAKEVAKLSLEDLLTFYDEFILGTKGTRSKLSVQCFGKDHPIPKEDTQETEKKKTHLLTVDKIPDFKEKCGYHPFAYTVTS